MIGGFYQGHVPIMQEYLYMRSSLFALLIEADLEFLKGGPKPKCGANDAGFSASILSVGHLGQRGGHGPLGPAPRSALD